MTKPGAIIKVNFFENHKNMFLHELKDYEHFWSKNIFGRKTMFSSIWKVCLVDSFDSLKSVEVETSG